MMIKMITNSFIRIFVCVLFISFEYKAVKKKSIINNSNDDVPKLIMLSFDALKPEHINANITPTLHRIMSEGVHGLNMKSTFVTKTLPNHFSIVTGYYQETHGIVNNVMYDPLWNETFDINNRDSKWWNNGITFPIWVSINYN